MDFRTDKDGLTGERKNKNEPKPVKWDLFTARVQQTQFGVRGA